MLPASGRACSGRPADSAVEYRRMRLAALSVFVESAALSITMFAIAFDCCEGKAPINELLRTYHDHRREPESIR
jgi:hypothetical protein